MMKMIAAQKAKRKQNRVLLQCVLFNYPVLKSIVDQFGKECHKYTRNLFVKQTIEAPFENRRYKQK